MAYPQPAMGPPSPLYIAEDTPFLWTEESEKNASDGDVEAPYGRPKSRRRCYFVTAAVMTTLLLSGTLLAHPQTAARASELVSDVKEAISSLHSTAIDSGWNMLKHLAVGAIAEDSFILDDTTPRIDVESEQSVEALDREVCGTSPCRFLIAGHMREGNSKAQLHLTQIAHLAKGLDRMLVLPNLGSGLLSTCHEHPFDLYYDLEATSKQLDVPMMVMHDFERYSQRRAAMKQQLTAQILRVGGVKATGPRFNFDVLQANALSRDACLRTASLNQSLYQHAVIGAHDVNRPAGLQGLGPYLLATIDTPDFIANITKDSSTTPPDAIFMLWGAGHRLWSSPKAQKGMADALLPHNQRWISLADEIARDLSPSVALHWRQEAVVAPPTIPDYVACAKAAHAKLDQYRGQLKSVYFLTDFSLNGTIHSITYDRTLRTDPVYRAKAEAGIAELYAWPGFHGENATRILTLDDLALEVPMANGTSVPMKDFDVGLLGIIDKMMADRAETYLVGQPHVCARRSSFSLQVVEERRLQIGSPGSLIKKVVEYFPKAGQMPYQ